jgi:hypothetical protein
LCRSLHPSGSRLISALGQKRTLKSWNAMSALPPKADIAERQFDVRFVPIGDMSLSLIYPTDWEAWSADMPWVSLETCAPS